MVERTRRDILNAFNKLIKTKDMDKITIEMLTKEAGISKATFYRYFIDKYDVMNYNYTTLLDYLSSPQRSKNYKDLYEQMYKYGRSNWKFMQKAFATYGKNSFGECIENYSKDLMDKIARHNRNGKGLSEIEQLQCDVFCKGIPYMYEKWIFEKYTMDAKEAAEALYQLTPATLRDMWW